MINHAFVEKQFSKEKKKKNPPFGLKKYLWQKLTEVNYKLRSVAKIN